LRRGTLVEVPQPFAGRSLVPLTLKKLAPANVVVRPLKENLNVITTAVAWIVGRESPLIDTVVAMLAGNDSGTQPIHRSE
jgi:hypothetical protein